MLSSSFPRSSLSGNSPITLAVATHISMQRSEVAFVNSTSGACRYFQGAPAGKHSITDPLTFFRSDRWQDPAVLMPAILNSPQKVVGIRAHIRRLVGTASRGSCLPTLLEYAAGSGSFFQILPYYPVLLPSSSFENEHLLPLAPAASISAHSSQNFVADLGDTSMQREIEALPVNRPLMMGFWEIINSIAANLSSTSCTLIS